MTYGSTGSSATGRRRWQVRRPAGAIHVIESDQLTVGNAGEAWFHNNYDDGAEQVVRVLATGQWSEIRPLADQSTEVQP